MSSPQPPEALPPFFGPAPVPGLEPLPNVSPKDQLLADIKLRAQQKQEGQVHIALGVTAAERLRAWRSTVGMAARFSADGVSFGAAVCVALDILELLGPRITEVISRDDFVELARAYPYRNVRAAKPRPIASTPTSRDPRSPTPLVRDEHGAVFTYGHRWKLARLNTTTEADGYMDVCTKCGARRYDSDDYPNTKECQFALEPDDFVGSKWAQSFQTPDLYLVWKHGEERRQDPSDPGLGLDGHDRKGDD